MHRFSSSSVITRLRIAAVLLCSKYLLVPAAAWLLIHALLIGNHRLILVAMGLVFAAVLAIFMQWVIARKARCPLCMTAVLANKACAKHRHAKALWGSHRLRVAIGILFRGSFVCPFCHEPSVMEVRCRKR